MAASGEEKKISTSELVASAKVVAEAAQSGFGKEVDKDKAAEAAADLLDGVSQYAKLDEQKGLGQYVDKAADYLHKYDGGAPPASKPDQPKVDDAAAAAAPAKSEDGGSAGGLGGLGGDFAKVAGGFFK
jgi:hypothetical protein